MVLGRKTKFFLGKTQKKTSFGIFCGQSPKRLFFVVFPRKNMVLVLGRKTNFSWEKDGFGKKNQLFPRENKKKQKKKKHLLRQYAARL